MKKDIENTKTMEVIEDLPSIIKGLQEDIAFYNERLPMDIDSPLYDTMVSDIEKMGKELVEKSQKLRQVKAQKLKNIIEQNKLTIL